jgi:esterase/lipase superfamily enzyme
MLDYCTEAGWQCGSCDESLGFRPDLDRDYTEVKVYNVLLAAHDANLLYVSNSDMGLLVSENVANECQRTDMYDQASILRFILEDPNMSSHGPFWREEADKFLAPA